MGAWQLKPGNLKKYPHFDPVIPVKAAMALVQDPQQVARHAFYPFMRVHQRWNRFSKKGKAGEPKVRPIRYAARADAYIFSYYRHVLSEAYERELARLSLGSCVLAYRRIPAGIDGGGKCNIHHVRDAISAIRSMRSCFVITLDISSFFESLEHTRLKSAWCRLLGVKRLPPDHFKVFEAITAYSVVDKQAVYERLAHFGPKRATVLGKTISGYLTPRADLPKQLCTGREFRQKIAGGDGQPSIVRKNLKPYGIPQGAPISDLLANLYLLDFDHEVCRRVNALGGTYLRYSDDILIIVPVEEAAACILAEEIRTLIRRFGSKLTIKEKKSAIFEFTPDGPGQSFRRVKGAQGRNGLEYLGFRYDGHRLYLRDSTLANLRRKIAVAAKREATALARRYPDKDGATIRGLLDLNRFVQRFGRVEDFREKQDNYRNWTFWTYARRAAEVLGPLGDSIIKQLRRHRSLVRARLENEVERAVARRHGKTI